MTSAIKADPTSVSDAATACGGLPPIGPTLAKIGASTSTAPSAIEAFRILLSDDKVRAVLVNIFGGIARCDTIAEALIAAAREVGFRVPVVVRLEGTNVERARELLEQARRQIPMLITAGDLTDAARKAVRAADHAA